MAARKNTIHELAADADELAAILLGVRALDVDPSSEIGKAIRRVADKVLRLDPAIEGRVNEIESDLAEDRDYPDDAIDDDHAPFDLGPLRRAVRYGLKVELQYSDGAGARSSRVVWPFELLYIGPTPGLGAWCELRRDYRNFALDRIVGLRVLDQRFDDPRGAKAAEWAHRFERDRADYKRRKAAATKAAAKRVP